MSIVLVQKEIYKPSFDENEDKFIDKCPYKLREKNRIQYQCRCKAGSTFTSRQEFIQHVKSQTHKTFIDNYSEYYKEVDEAEEKNKSLIAENEILKRKVELREDDIKERGDEITSLTRELTFYKQKNECLESNNKKLTNQLHTLINCIDGVCENINYVSKIWIPGIL